MSTYTDLKNRVKETITVGFKPEDRVTTQKVRFYNEENEYWGTFSGGIKGKAEIFQGTLSSVDIYGATLVDPVLKTSEGGRIELGTFGDQLQELSTYAHEDLLDAIGECAADIQAISDSVSAIPSDLSGVLDGLKDTVEALSVGVYGALESESNARRAADEQTASEISGLSAAFDNECSARQAADESISSALTAYADGAARYEIYTMDDGPAMPIKAREFAVNRLVNYDMPDAFVVYPDTNQIVGHVEGYNSETGSCKFIAYSDADYDIKFAQILGLNEYSFDSSVSARTCNDAQYELVYVKSTDGDFESNKFDIRPVGGGSGGYPNLEFRRRYDKAGYWEYGVGDIVIEIPDKPDGSTKSREFLFMLQPRAAEQGRFANVRFMTPQGDPVYFDDGSPAKMLVECGKCTSFRFQEVDSGRRFMVFDISQSEIVGRLDDLDARLAREIQDRAAGDDALSAAVEKRLSLDGGEVSGVFGVRTENGETTIDGGEITFNGRTLQSRLDEISAKSFGYDDAEQSLYIEFGGQMLTADVSKLAFDGMLSDAYIAEYEVSSGLSSKALFFVVELAEGGTKTVSCDVADLIDVYRASGDGIELSDDKTFYLDWSKVASVEGLAEKLDSKNENYEIGDGTAGFVITTKTDDQASVYEFTKPGQEVKPDTVARIYDLRGISSLFYPKTETSSAAQLSDAFANVSVDLSGYATVADLEAVESRLSGFVTAQALSDGYYSKTETSSSNQISAALADLTASVDLSGYYKKTETSSAGEIQNAFDSLPSFENLSGYYKKTETSSSAEIDAADAALSGRIENLEAGLSSYAAVSAVQAVETRVERINSSLNNYLPIHNEENAGVHIYNGETPSTFSIVAHNIDALGNATTSVLLEAGMTTDTSEGYIKIPNLSVQSGVVDRLVLTADNENPDYKRALDNAVGVEFRGAGEHVVGLGSMIQSIIRDSVAAEVKAEIRDAITRTFPSDELSSNLSAGLSAVVKCFMDIRDELAD